MTEFFTKHKKAVRTGGMAAFSLAVFLGAILGVHALSETSATAASYVKLGIAALLPTILTVDLYLLEQRTAFGSLDKNLRQVIYGVLFGILAIVGTEWGIPLNGAQANCRDAAVLTAGLLFGAPAGIIAGIIGGVERWIAVAWGVGTFTRVACTLSTMIAGVYAAILRKFMFENKKPGWLIALAIGVVMEVFHLTMVFLTNMDTPEQAMAVVAACSIPMIIANGVSVLLSAVAVTILSRRHEKKREKGKKQERISQTIQKWLLVTVVLAFAATSYFVYQLQTEIALAEENDLFAVALDEAVADIRDAGEGADAVFLTKNRHVGKTGYILVLDKDYQPIGIPESAPEIAAKDLMGIASFAENTTFTATLGGEKCALCRRKVGDVHIVAVLPEAEALQTRNIILYVNSFMEILVFAVMFGLIYMLIRHVVVMRIQSVNESLAKITGGDLSEQVNVRTNAEFSSLSDDINRTVETLKHYIDEASARIDKELEFAKNIQSSALPSVFPAFPKRKDFDIFAMMNPAKEVGGDFYDFYLTNQDTLHFLIADVSGKGIPAAMFMMRAKTELKSLTENELPIDAVFTNGNRALCEGNDAGMFVTAWQGGIDLTTGVVKYANAGHNPPLVRHADGKFEYLRSRAGFVLAGMDGIPYRAQELTLERGDTLFLYTDGVTEATNKDNELYGEERLLAAINSRDFISMEELCRAIRADVDAFVGDAPQFDDITMLAFRYIGVKPAPSMHFDEATLDDIPTVTAFVEEELEKLDCPMKATMQISVAIDEIFSNIVRYGYPNGKGPVTVSVVEKQDPHTVCIRFCDRGVPYNPLTKEDPDVTLSAEERSIGGLGIYMVKKTMDDMKYRYENGQNIFTIFKKIGD